MHPNSTVLLVLLVVLGLRALVLLRRAKRRLTAAVAAFLAFLLAATTGMAAVNDYYGYYQSWHELSDDLTGSYTAFTTPVVSRVDALDGSGQLRSIELRGARSGIDHDAPDGPTTSWLTDPDGCRIELVQWPAGHGDGLSHADFAR